MLTVSFFPDPLISLLYSNPNVSLDIHRLLTHTMSESLISSSLVSPLSLC